MLRVKYDLLESPGPQSVKRFEVDIKTEIQISKSIPDASSRLIKTKFVLTRLTYFITVTSLPVYPRTWWPKARSTPSFNPGGFFKAYPLQYVLSCFRPLT